MAKKRFNKRTNKIWFITQDELIRAVKTFDSYSKVLTYFKLKPAGSNIRTLKYRIKEENIECKYPEGNKGRSTSREMIPLEEVLIEKSSYRRASLKKRLLKNGLLENKCYVCGLGDSWNGKVINHTIDHINGVNNDNRIENLRMICPNCDSQQPTYAGKNKKREFC